MGKKPLPHAASDAIAHNLSNVEQLNQAIKALQANPNAIGLLKGLMTSTDWSNNRLDSSNPSGITARALISRAGGLETHDLYGGNVTKLEKSVGRSFIPTVSDASNSAIQKAILLRDYVASLNDNMVKAYDPNGRYEIPQELLQALEKSRPAKSVDLTIAQKAQKDAARYTPPQGAAPQATPSADDAKRALIEELKQKHGGDLNKAREEYIRMQSPNQ
jgi:hypothetical protein